MKFLGEKVLGAKCQLSSHHIRGTHCQHDVDCWCWPWSPGWGSACQICSLWRFSPTHLPYCPLWNEITKHSLSLRSGEWCPPLWVTCTSKATLKKKEPKCWELSAILRKGLKAGFMWWAKGWLEDGRVDRISWGMNERVGSGWLRGSKHQWLGDCLGVKSTALVYCQLSVSWLCHLGWVILSLWISVCLF